MIYIICKEIQSEENLGSIARVMDNFGFDKLILVNPKCNPTDFKAEIISKHAKQILQKAKVVGEAYLEQFDYVIATTAILGTDYNILRSPLTAKQLAEKLQGINGINAADSKLKIAILFGNEGTGLSNNDILKADFIVTIAANCEYPTLNISHACAIILYELFSAGDTNNNNNDNRKSKNKKSNSHIISATLKEKEVLSLKIKQAINSIKWSTPEKKRTQYVIWKRVISKALLTKREIFALLGFFRKLGK
ncbi:TrmJ/YjtD family RNA methyltransferase [Candidatus Woesearchaeota archaeon]|nr:TrmJ/YjtD family RNA methyltransferase [Candidatus Woesearchaeota archaeon]